MYDNLILRLRNCATQAAPCKACDMIEDDSCIDTLMKQAADAIEDLIMRLHDGVAAIAGMQCEIERMVVLGGKPRWIPVTERLPKAERKSYWVCTDTGYQCECRWTNDRFGIIESDEWGWKIFDIPQYQKVVAWMPLPDPYEQPKEET